MTSQDTCYVCLLPENDRNEFVDACECKGSIKIHDLCFEEIRKLKSTCDICKSNYKTTGFVVEYSNPGITGSGFMIKGVKQGRWTYCYYNGQKYKEGEYTNGLMDGYWKYYYENFFSFQKETIEREGWMRLGTPHGYWKYYNKDGSLNRRLKMML